MKSGMKKNILLAIFIFLGHSCFGAGWNTNAWPSTNNFRFTNVSDYVTVTNLYAKEWVVDVKVTNTVTVGVGRSDMIEGYSSTGYVYTISTNAGVSGTSLWTKIGIPAGTASNWFFLDDQVTYLTEIEQDNDSLLSFGVTNVTVNYYDIIYEQSFTGIIYSVQIEETLTEIGLGVKTNLSLNIKDLRSWDTYNALKERGNVASTTNSEVPRYYRHERTNLVEFKEFLVHIIDDFVDTNLVITNYLNVHGKLPSYDTATQLLAWVSAPTNYLEYTPWRQLNGSGIAYGRVVTSSFVLVGTGTVTNEVYGYYGSGPYSVTGVAGSTASIADTNVDIEVGFTTLDYGWKFMDEICNELVWTTEPADLIDLASSNYYGIGTNTNWTAAKGSAESAFSWTNNGDKTVQMYSTGTTDGTNYWVAEIRAKNAEATMTEIYTNIPYEAWLFVRANALTEPSATYTIFDNNGLNLASNVWSEYVTTTGTNVTVGSLSIPVWCPAPVGPVVTNYRQGFQLDVDDVKWMAKWNGATNGFKYYRD